MLRTVKDNPQQRFLLDTSSGDLSLRAKKILPYLYCLKTNLLEAKTLTGTDISGKKSLENAAFFFHKKGVKHVLITLGKNGVFFSSCTHTDFFRTDGYLDEANIICGKYLPEKTKLINSNGAGDAFMAGFAFGVFENLQLDVSIKMGMALAKKSLEHVDAVNPEITAHFFERNSVRSDL